MLAFKAFHELESVNLFLNNSLLKYGRENSDITILEGILPAEVYMPLFEMAVQEYGKDIFAFYYDLPFKETLQRHATKPNKEDFGEQDMKRWWKEKDYIDIIPEKIITKTLSVSDTVDMSTAEGDGYMAIIWKDRTYVPFCPVSKNDCGTQIGYLDGETGDRVCEYMDYPTEKWIANYLTVDGGAILFKEINVTDIPDGSKSEYPWNAEKRDLIPMVNDVLYLATGYERDANGKHDTFDGKITSEVGGSEMPTVNDQSNFGIGYGYQYSTAEGIIEIYMNDNWQVFATEKL